VCAYLLGRVLDLLGRVIDLLGRVPIYVCVRVNARVFRNFACAYVCARERERVCVLICVCGCVCDARVLRSTLECAYGYKY